MSILITRASNQNQSFMDILLDNSYFAVAMPLMQIEPYSDAKQRLARLMQYQWDSFIFISSNAARIGLALLKPYATVVEQAQILCVGPATYECVKTILEDDFNITDKTVHCAAAPYRSESLLRLPQLSANTIAGSNILIFKGANGRTLLYDEIKQRHALPTNLSLYQRQPITKLADKFLQINHKPSILTAMSAETTQVLVNTLTEARLKTWFKLPIIVPGKRVSQLASELGFDHVVSIDYPSPQLLLETVKLIEPRLL